MYFLLGILCALIWIAIAFWPARVAGRKGHSFIGYFIFSVVFFPAALIRRVSRATEGCSSQVVRRVLGQEMAAASGDGGYGVPLRGTVRSSQTARCFS